MKEIIDVIRRYNEEKPFFVKNEVYPGIDYVLGLCDDGISQFTIGYSRGVNRELFGMGIRIFKQLKNERKTILSGDRFASMVEEVLK